MNISNLHQSDKSVSAVSLFKSELGNAIAIQILSQGTLKEHITKTPALLVCITGNVDYEDENGIISHLESGDYHHIEANVKHWLVANSNSQLMLIK